jgi:histidinol dehydrogenase
MLEVLDLRARRERLEPRRLEIDPHVSDTVRGIVRRVHDEGDDALLDLALRFDGADLREHGLVVSPDEFASALDGVPETLRQAIDDLVARVADLHRRQMPPEWQDERAGVRFGERVRPVRAAGCYVPGGRAVYPSSVAMTATPAVVAGVEEIVVCTPPRSNGTIHPEVLYAARVAGATRVVKSGGAQAIAALAFGTDSVPAVDVVVGPGNAYVTEAKRQLTATVGIDGLAGPTELVLVADGEADPRLVALDLIAQAEHDPDALATLVLLEDSDLQVIETALEHALMRAERRDVIDAAMRHARVVLAADVEHAVAIVDDLAPEHLQIVTREARAFARAVRNAGAIFVGPATAVPFGDYGVASNHVLPTAGTARFSSGLRVTNFLKVMSVVEVSPEGVASLAPGVSTLARSEGLIGHARAVEVRAEPEA